MAASTTADNVTAYRPNVKALLFIFTTTFLGAMGIGLLNPVAPFLVSRYVSDPSQSGLVLGWLTSIYAICQFIAAPALAVLSDRFGRRGILLICLLGSAVGYLVFGIGGALWVLFAGRIIDGITGANFAVTFAYVADITPPQLRGRYFGWIGATAGIGIILGPTIGGLLAKFGYTVPLYAAAVITFGNILYGLLFAPESLPAEKRIEHITIRQLNPLSILFRVFSLRPLRWLLIVIFLYSVPFAVLESNLSLLAKDTLNWDADAIGVLFGLVGLTDIVVQGVLLTWLLKRWGEKRVAISGMGCEVVGYALIALTVFLNKPAPILIGTIVFAIGDGLLGSSINGLLSSAAGERGQGQGQGGSQAIQALARMVGPILGGLLYSAIGHAVPYLGGAGLVLLTAILVNIVVPASRLKIGNAQVRPESEAA